MLADITLTLSTEFLHGLYWFAVGTAVGAVFLRVADAMHLAKVRKARRARAAQTRF